MAPAIVYMVGAYRVDNSSPGPTRFLALSPTEDGANRSIVSVSGNYARALPTSAFNISSPTSVAATFIARSQSATDDSAVLRHDKQVRGHVVQLRRLLQATSPLPVEPTLRVNVSGNYSNGRSDSEGAVDSVTEDSTSVANRTSGRRKFDSIPRRWFHVVNAAQVRSKHCFTINDRRNSFFRSFCLRCT